MPQDLIRPMTSDQADYLRDESRLIGQAEWIAFPETEQQLREILASCHRSGRPVTVQGARTGIAAAAVPAGGVVLSLTRLNRVRGMKQNADGRYVLCVEPGVILSRLRKQIEDRHFAVSDWDEPSRQLFEQFRRDRTQFFTPDPTEATASLGGMVACNASGARSYRYGPVRRHVRGLRVVLADGQTLDLQRGREKAAGRTLNLTTEQGGMLRIDLPAYALPQVKSAAGYYAADDMDAVDLFIGSDGTLGVISQIELVLQPLPDQIWGVTCFFGEEEQAWQFTEQVRAAGETGLLALEYFDRQALMMLARYKAGHPAFARLELPQRPFGAAIYCELQGEREDQLLEAVARLGRQMEHAGASPEDSWVARTAFDRDQLLFFRHAAPECVNLEIDRNRQREPSLTKLGTDMSVPNGKLTAVMHLYREDLKASGLPYAIWGHIGDNHVHVNILPRTSGEYETGKTLYRSWARQIVAWGGSVSAEHGIGKLKAEYLALMFGEQSLSEMKRVKKACDPDLLFGRGNLFAPPEGRKAE